MRPQVVKQIREVFKETESALVCPSDKSSEGILVKTNNKEKKLLPRGTKRVKSSLNWPENDQKNDNNSSWKKDKPGGGFYEYLSKKHPVTTCFIVYVLAAVEGLRSCVFCWRQYTYNIKLDTFHLCLSFLFSLRCRFFLTSLTFCWCS